MADFGADFATVWTVPSIVVAILGGVLAGLTLAQPHKVLGLWKPALARAILQGLMVGWLGTIYYAGRMGVAVVEDDPHFGRTVGAWTLWLMFSVALGFGILADHWWNARHPVPNGNGVNGTTPHDPPIT